MSLAFILVAAFALQVIFALSSVVLLSKNIFQQIFRIILDFRTPPTLLPASQQYKNPCKRQLKARFPYLYWSKTYSKCYTFLHQCEDHFATGGDKDQNWVSFAAILLKDTALFCWQQHQQKMEDETNIFIT